MWQCAACEARWAPGAPRCPECPSTVHVEVDEVPKIDRTGRVSYEPGSEPQGVAQQPEQDAAEVQERPADGTVSPVVSNDVPAAPEPVAEPERPHAPVAPPRRRSAPPGAASG